MTTKNYVKLDDVYLDGTIYWANLFDKNKVTDRYELDLIPDDMEEVKEMGVIPLKGFLDTHGNLYKDSKRDDLDENGNIKYTVDVDDIEFVNIRSSLNSMFPIKVKYDDESVSKGTKVGNGSTVRVRCELANTTFNRKDFIKLMRPNLVRVKQLVRYAEPQRDERMYA